MEGIKLSNGVELPSIGMGTWQIGDREVLTRLIETGRRLGYSLIDTAAAYSNERQIGRALAETGTGRREVFLSDKVWNTCRGYEKTIAACKASLKKLKTDYLDLYLIHWPASSRQHSDWKELNADTWRGMEALYREGLVRAIGVCNFQASHLEELMKTAEVMPMVNQIEFHPGMLQEEIIRFCRENGICVEASSPLGNGRILDNEVLAGIAREKRRTPAQICLRYALEQGICVIPKTVSVRRLAENMDIFGFSLTQEERRQIEEIPYCGGIGIDPEEAEEILSGRGNESVYPDPEKPE